MAPDFLALLNFLLLFFFTLINGGDNLPYYAAIICYSFSLYLESASQEPSDHAKGSHEQKNAANTHWKSEHRCLELGISLLPRAFQTTQFSTILAQ